MLIKNYPISILKKRLKDEREKSVHQRIQIILLLREGNSQRDVSLTLHVSTGIVPYWKARFEKGSFEGLKDKKGRGRKSLLSKKQISYLEKSVEEGITMKDGYKRGFKTKDAREFILREFKIGYTQRNCRKILHLIRFNLKVPRPRNKSRNQESIDEFKQDFKKNLKVWTRI